VQCQVRARAASGRHCHRREAWSGRRALACGASGRVSARFWYADGAAQLCEHLRKGAADLRRGAPLSRQRRLAGETPVGDRITREAQVDRGQDEQPRPAVSGARGAQFGRGPAQRLLEEAEGVFQREVGDIGLPDLRSIRRSRSRPPEPQRLRDFRGPRQAFDCQPEQAPARTAVGRCLQQAAGSQEPLDPHPCLSVLWAGARPRSERGAEHMSGRAGPSGAHVGGCTEPSLKSPWLWPCAACHVPRRSTMVPIVRTKMMTSSVSDWWRM
jgi:hypothetical protein